MSDIKKLLNTPTDAQREHRAAEMRRELRRLALSDGQAALASGQVLHDIKRQELWRYHADSWREFLEDLGIASHTDFIRRRVYEVFVIEGNMDIADPRLIGGSMSKLGVGTRRAFVPWVLNHLDEFLTAATAPIGEGGLARGDLYAWLEEQVGIGLQSEASALTRATRSLRRTCAYIRSLSDDARDVLAQTIKNDEDIFDTLLFMTGYADKKQRIIPPENMPTEEVDIDVEDEW